jgi:hypothetical protein
MQKPRGLEAPTANRVHCSDIDVFAPTAEEADVLHVGAAARYGVGGFPMSTMAVTDP